MKSNIRHNEPVYRACFSQDVPKIESVIPFAWIHDDIHAVFCLSAEGSCLTTMTHADLSSYGDIEQAKKNLDIGELRDDINRADSNRLAEAILGCAEVLMEIRVLMARAQRSKEKNEFIEDIEF